MPPLPTLSGREVVRAFTKDGWEMVRQREAAHAKISEFLEIVRRREGLLHFGEVGSLLAASPEQALDTLFERLIHSQPRLEPV